MVLRLIEEDLPLHEIVFFDTGWEFPELLEHIDKLERYIGRPITRLQPTRPFEYWMLERPVVARKGPLKGQVHRIGNGWPSPMRRWCKREKVAAIDRYCGGDSIRYIGYAADGAHRCDKTCASGKSYPRLYPLVDYWVMDEAGCLAYCKARGFDWGGLYDHYRRVSCFCCPLQRIGELRTLRRLHPQLWQQMLAWEDAMESRNRGFKDYVTVHDLDRRFAKEGT